MKATVPLPGTGSVDVCDADQRAVYPPSRGIAALTPATPSELPALPCQTAVWCAEHDGYGSHLGAEHTLCGPAGEPVLGARMRINEAEQPPVLDVWRDYCGDLELNAGGARAFATSLRQFADQILTDAGQLDESPRPTAAPSRIVFERHDMDEGAPAMYRRTADGTVRIAYDDSSPREAIKALAALFADLAAAEGR